MGQTFLINYIAWSPATTNACTDHPKSGGTLEQVKVFPKFDYLHVSPGG